MKENLSRKSNRRKGFVDICHSWRWFVRVFTQIINKMLEKVHHWFQIIIKIDVKYEMDLKE